MSKFQYTYKADSETPPNSPHEGADKSRAAIAAALVLGIVGTLVFGLGLAMVLEWNILVWGSVVGVSGLVPLVSAYPVYNKISKRNK